LVTQGPLVRWVNQEHRDLKDPLVTQGHQAHKDLLEIKDQLATQVWQVLKDLMATQDLLDHLDLKDHKVPLDLQD